jgi:hypothetical protein
MLGPSALWKAMFSLCFPFFIVSKERATRNYSYVKDGDPDNFSYNFQIMGFRA